MAHISLGVAKSLLPLVLCQVISFYRFARGYWITFGDINIKGQSFGNSFKNYQRFIS
jgi:hypothetical protein